MTQDAIAAPAPEVQNPFSASDVADILRERGWIADASLLGHAAADENSPLSAWCARAAQLLAPQAASREAFADLLSLIFTYDAAAILREASSHAALARSGAREVIREAANYILSSGEIDSDNFKSLIDMLKAALPYRGPALFAPIRLALTGRIGEGELDRVILLLDSAAKFDFTAPVKNCRGRSLEFCAALD